MKNSISLHNKWSDWWMNLKTTNLLCLYLWAYLNKNARKVRRTKKRRKVDWLRNCVHRQIVTKLRAYKMGYNISKKKKKVPLKVYRASVAPNELTHWGWVTHICVNNIASIDSDNGVSPSRRQAIIWSNAGILLIGPLGTNFSQILIEIHKFSLKKMLSQMSSGKWRQFCFRFSVLTKTSDTYQCFR